ncbi:hypothetical protein EJ05DRAFT_511785 [Pseudovirgaria hyperparasitica]|uniref:Stress-associated endoplasmic reticulum protein n=1 Tax=Pseudovirgaria hyperparasitica TaxID=470096 RepID=A0A6A6W290_9PEZI|nr:uncharacterized protein EJ05DRAFT_511785 [Pseudovirgaria hyperparasitica]KAF2757038.1 hypothetical protein EJ05DRAFT_511785 [Pseudovirgaria hyperparasitica]
MANAKYAKREEAKHGKPQAALQKKEVHKSPISKGWIILLAFVVCGGLIVELLRFFF